MSSSPPSTPASLRIAEKSGEVAAQHAQSAGRLVGLGDGIDHLAVDRRGAEALDLLGQRLAGAGQDVAVQQPGIEQFAHDHLDAARGIDVDHGILAVGPGVGQHGHDALRQVIELLRRHDLLPEVGIAGGAGDLGRVQRDVGRAADGHGDDDRVAQGIADHDVARLQTLLDHAGQMPDQLGRELFQPARIVGRRRHHVQRLHADDADEGLHRVVGEHAAAAADPGAGMAGDAVAELGVGVAGDLIGADDVERVAGDGVVAGVDRAVRHDDGRLVVLQQGGQGADRGLSQATTAIVPARPVASRCSHSASCVTSRPISE